VTRIFSILIFLFCFIAFSQDDDNCALDYIPKDKKALKHFQNSKNEKKFSYAERFQEMKKVLEYDENCGPCIYYLARNSFQTAQVSGGNYDKAATYFDQLINVCPNYHADAYYNLGVIYYGKEESEKALKYFKGFLAFKSDEVKRVNKNYEKQLKDVKDILQELEFTVHFYNNPVAFNPKIVKNVSTEKEEYLPMLSPDNQLLFFTRRYSRKNVGSVVSVTIEELMMSQHIGNGEYSSGVAMKHPFNQEEYTNYGGVSISPDNREMFVCACKMEGGYNNCDIYVTAYHKEENEKGQMVYVWSNLQNLGPNINGAQTWEAQPSISSDGKTLYYAKIGPDTQAHDIYYSEKQSDGTWGVGKPLSNVINTPGNDKSPFIHSDSKTLYFVSEVQPEYGRYGAGGYDIYFTRQDETTGEWEKPQNIGYPINTSGNEEGLIVSLDGETAFFFSDKQKVREGGRDIYSFNIPQYAKPEKVVIVKGQVTFDTEEQKENSKLEIRYGDEEVSKEIDLKSDEDGNYVAVVTVGKEPKDVLLTVKSEGAAFESKIITKEAVISNPIVASDLKVETLKANGNYTIKEILYTTNSAELEESSKLILKGFAIYLKEHPSLYVEISGHTDDIGNANENLVLSKNRAETVMNYLIDLGVSAERLSAKGYGKTKPKVPNTSAQNRAQNRRTDFAIKKL
jgi:outer membrane protein OmpA-like peptidoglycan-associated protein/tetratricopeptide (TPR) repeat protein